MSYKTEIKTIDSDLFFVVPEIFVKPLRWHKGDTVDFELLDGKLLVSRV